MSLHRQKKRCLFFKRMLTSIVTETIFQIICHKLTKANDDILVPLRAVQWDSDTLTRVFLKHSSDCKQRCQYWCFSSCLLTITSKENLCQTGLSNNLQILCQVKDLLRSWADGQGIECFWRLIGQKMQWKETKKERKSIYTGKGWCLCFKMYWFSYS